MLSKGEISQHKNKSPVTPDLVDTPNKKEEGMERLDQISVAEYDSLHDVINESKSVLILDLARLGLEIRSLYKHCLKPEPEGVYVRGRLEPLIDFNKTKALSVSNYRRQHFDDYLKTFDDFMACPEPVMDIQGQVITTIRPSLTANIFQKTCSFDRAAIYNAAYVVFELLKRLHPATYPTSTTKILQKLDLYLFVKPEHIGHPDEEGMLEYNEEDHPGIEALMQRVYDFVGRDYACLYHLEMKNTELLIHKGNDYRIVEYYKGVFDRVEEYKNNQDGILKIY